MPTFHQRHKLSGRGSNAGALEPDANSVYMLFVRQLKQMLRKKHPEEKFDVKRLGLIVFILFILLICLCFSSGTVNYAFVELIVKRSSDLGLGARGAFVESLMENDARIAKALTVPEQWGRIDTWMFEHEAFNCPFSLDPENVMMRVEGSYISYSCSHQGYVISVEDLSLQNTEDGWQITDWGEICERKGRREIRKCY